MTTGRDGTDRIVITARTFIAKYRNGKDHVVEVATGCRDEASARAVLIDLEKAGRQGTLGVAEDSAIDHQKAAIAGRIAAFIDHLTLKGKCSRPKETRAQLQSVANACGFRTLAKIDPEAFNKWLLAAAETGMSAARRNKYRSPSGNWMSTATRHT